MAFTNITSAANSTQANPIMRILGLAPFFGILLVVALICLLPGQLSIAPIDDDDARNAQISKQMNQSGDYFTPRYQKTPHAQKPIAMHWMQAASANLLNGEHITSYRLPSLLGGIFLVLLTAGFGRLILPRRSALFAGLFAATCITLVIQSRLAHADALLAAVVAIQQIGLWRIQRLSDEGHYVSGKYAGLFWLAMATAVLIKGFIAPIIAILTVGALILARRQWRDGSWRWILTLRPLLGMIVLSVMILPWAVLTANITDVGFLDLTASPDVDEDVASFVPLPYMVLAIVLFWPSSLFLPRAIAVIKSRWREPNILFLLCWLVPFWIVLEITPDKMPHYLLPVSMAFVILAMLGLDQPLPETPDQPAGRRLWLWQKIKSLLSLRSLIVLWEWVFLAAGPALGVAALYVATFAGGNRTPAVFVIIAGCGVSLGAFIWQGKSNFLGSRVFAASVMIVSCMAFYGVLFSSVVPSLERIYLAPRIKAEVDKITPVPQLITASGYDAPSLVFALGTDTLLFTPAEAAFFLAESPRGLALVEQRGDAIFLATAAQLGLRLRIIASVKGYDISRRQSVEILFYQRLDS